MSLSNNPFVNLSLSQLLTMQTQWLQVLSDIAGGGTNYTFPGRSFTRANLAEVRETLSLLSVAIRFSRGTGVQSAQVRIDTQSKFAT